MNMEKIKGLSELAYKHLMDRDPSRWSKAFFPTTCTVDSVDNNMCESFNNWILEARVQTSDQYVRVNQTSTVSRIREKRKYMTDRMATGRRFGHRVLAALEDSITNSRDCYSMWCNDMNFEVNGTRGGTIVNLTAWTCTCRAWQLNGIPCCHAVSAITSLRRDPEDYIYECLKGETYLKCYEHMLKAMNGIEKWPESDKPVLLPPPPRILKGRPKWNRRKDALEDGRGKGTNENPPPLQEDPFRNIKKSKKGIKMTCRLCKQEGHNIRKCPDRPVNDNPQTVDSAPRREKQVIRRRGGRSGGMDKRNNGLERY
ncbi:hypothetical protein OROMI_009062 [Orobanche minor]